MKNKTQTGVSLVSLMIGMGLSAFLTLVLLQVFSSSRSNYAAAESIIEMDDAMNFMVSTLSNIIPLAGYRSPPADGSELTPMTTAFKCPGNPTCPANPAIPNIYTDGVYIAPFSSPNNKDGFTIAYQGNDDGLVKDCNGAKIKHAETVYLTFQQQSNNLLCQRYGANKNTEIVSKVLAEFWVRYGEDTDDKGQVKRYLTAQQMATQQPPIPNYLKVRAIQIAVLLRSSKEVFPTPNKFEFIKWGEKQQLPEDKYAYKFMTFTFYLPHLPDPA